MAGLTILTKSKDKVDGSSDSTSDSYVPWNDTIHSQEARIVLQKIFDHYSDDSLVSKYIKDNCSHLLQEPKGHTGIKLEDINPTRLAELVKSTKLTKEFIPSNFPSSSGVYSVSNPVTNDQYIGSALNFRSRWESHYQDSVTSRASPLHKQLITEGHNTFYWAVIKLTTNYAANFVRSGVGTSLSFKDLRALQILSQYENRLYEQSIITAVNPTLNGGLIVVFSFKWVPDAEFTLRGDRPILAIEKDSGDMLEFSSIRSAVKVLDMDQRSIKGIMNYEGYTRVSRSTGKQYSFLDLSLPMLEGSPHYNSDKPLFEDVDTTIIPTGHVWAYDTDLNKVAEFKSRKHAAKECGVTATSVVRNLDRIFTSCIYKDVACSLMFLTNRVKVEVEVPILAKDITTGITTQYPSVQALQKALNLSTGGYLRKGGFYLDTDKVYKKRWLFYSPDNYTGKL